MNSIKIIKVTPQAVETLQAIGQQTFLQTFGASNTPENMASYLKKSFSKAQLTAELKNRHSNFYFALRSETVVGYLKVNFGPSQTELQDDNALEIERIYVLQQFHGKQVGQALYNKALHIAKQENMKYIWLGVWEKNYRALSFYKKNGFEVFDKHRFTLGHDEQTDLMLKLSL